MGLSTAPMSAFYLAWFALIPLWVFTIKTHKGINIFEKKLTIKSFLFDKKTWIALFWGLGYHGLSLFWIMGIHPMTWMKFSWVASFLIAIICWLFITLWGAILVATWSLTIRFFDCLEYRNIYFKKTLISSCLRVIFGVAIWCLLESIWSQGPLWWTSLSYTQSPDNLAILQLSQFSGFSTVTATIVAVNGLIAEGIILRANQSQFRKVTSQKKSIWLRLNQYNNHSFTLFLMSTIVLFILHFTGLVLYNLPVLKSEKDAIKIGIIQGNIPNTIKLYPEGLQKATDRYTNGYKLLAYKGADLIITPETALPFNWNDIVINSPLYSEILTHKVPVLLGAFGRRNNSYTNSLFSVTGEGKILSRFDKVKLVPLGEYIPFESILGKVIDRLSPLDSHLKAGNNNQIFKTPFGQAIVGICYESAFSEHFRRQAKIGGEFIITASNNAHYSEAMPAQHHAQDIIRAIETGKWMARVTNTGYSGIVNPRGQTLWISDINTYQLHQEKIYRSNSCTLYVQWGDWLTKVLLLLGIILLYFKIK
ncbi:MAG: apolipoprotein N-acyltransferase [cyanobacterium endosymbiont of Rhopalodia musculus]|uniref:apolipoprotein N-acyltransferase n=1 Tax=cyanobacterium endosymbiont of Epithemia clementina EcSB TaxID=3034674 RepID=UPI002480E6B9|nr:apolipoprotein N-acyltransferase [cyanobacterium endosymbiont of Epithemia clementina EcSB]WGT66837.1 apolipoprotein N-acyltransferase [cyanobacterium endosymbiont of Epithemia clementina EcSB]